MKLAAIQMVSTPHLQRNLQAAQTLLATAAEGGAQIAALPEYFCLMGNRDTDKLAIAESEGCGPIQEFLRDQARAHRLWLVGGTLPVAVPGNPDRVRNTCLVFDPTGQCIARYDKIHLFAFERGGERYDEARVLEAGDAPCSFTAGEHRVGLSVCYDLRFPELFRALSLHSGSPQHGCDLMCVPSAFTWTTGQAHWDVLLRARAIENQCYVLAPAQGGQHQNGRRTWGHSSIIDPWGNVVAQCVEGEGVALANLDSARMQEVRRQLPALSHRRSDLFLGSSAGRT